MRMLLSFTIVFQLLTTTKNPVEIQGSLNKKV